MHRDPHKLSELLDVVEIVLGFLASAGGTPDQTFQFYITKTLTMQRAHLPKVNILIFNYMLFVIVVNTMKLHGVNYRLSVAMHLCFSTIASIQFTKPN